MSDRTKYKGSECPNYEDAFVHKSIVEGGNAANHVMYCDPEIFDKCGYCTHDEGAVLYQLACAKPGHWLEVGCHTGWSTVHLAGENNKVTALDPEFLGACYNYTKDPQVFLNRFQENIFNALGDRATDVTPCGIPSHFYYKDLPPGILFDGIYIDGNHQEPAPTLDAMLAEHWLKPNGIIAFHDGIGTPVQAGAYYLESKGFRKRIYNTANFVIACTQDPTFKFPSHTPDPAVDWDKVMKCAFASGTIDVFNRDIDAASKELQAYGYRF